jgi:hypothetical protein
MAMPSSSTVALVMIALTTTARASTLHVYDGSIQAAIDGATDADKIIVHPGTYSELIDFSGKAITLRSSDGPDVTILDGRGEGPVVRCQNNEGPDTVLEGFTIIGGQASFGGGMYISDASPTIVGCTFRANDASMGADVRGGAMYVFGGSPLVTECTFVGNTVGGLGSNNAFGAGVFLNRSNAAVINCRFLGNTATADFPAGIVSAGGGGICVLQGSAAVVNCLFSGNAVSATAGSLPGDEAQAFGGGVVSISADMAVVNGTFTGNAVTVPAPHEVAAGAGVCGLAPGTVTVDNSIFYQNDTGMPAPDVYGTLTVSYSCVFPAYPLAGEGNILANPLFVNARGPDGTFGTLDDDVHLTPQSPCLDTGDTGAAWADWPELDGHARVLCETVDMGAYELGIGDYECDDDVDLGDFASWDACMTGPHHGPYLDGCEAFDFEFDGDVDMTDFAQFQMIFEGQP